MILAAAADEVVGEVPDAGRPWWLELGAVVPRSVAYSIRAARPRAGDDIPAMLPTPLSWATVAIDEFTMSAAYLMTRHSGREVTTTAQEAAVTAVDRLRVAGVLDDPASLHPAPALPTDVRRTERHGGGLPFEHVSWPSAWAPPVALPIDDSWRDPYGNGRAHAFLLRHGDRPRPWVVMLHGQMMGEPRDIRFLGSGRLREALGADIAHVVLPMHGPRSRGTGHPFPGLDPVLNLIGMSQALSDARALIAMLREESPGAPVGAFGISLGGHVTALLAAFEPSLACVVAGVPTADVSTMLADTMRGHWGDDVVATSHVLDEAPRVLSRLVSPLGFAPQVAPDARFVYAAIGDRLVTPEQALALWRHWERPPIKWLQGGHIINNVRATRRFVTDAMRSRGVTGTPAA